MSRLFSLSSRLRVFLILAMGISIFTVILPATAHAYTIGSPPIGRGWANNAEYNAWYACNYGPGTQYNARGAIWFSNNAGNFYAQDVNVSDGQNLVRVYIRGSAYGCANGINNQSIYAIKIAPQNTQYAPAEAWRLTGLSGTSLYRGQFPGTAQNHWTSSAALNLTGTITASLDVSGLATNNSNSSASQTIQIDLYRCFSTDGVTRAGQCYPETIDIKVNRSQKPNTWNVSGASTISVAGGAQKTGTVDAFPGQGLRWNHSLRNNGPSNMLSNVSYAINRTGFTNGWSASTAPSGLARGNANTTFLQLIAPGATNSSYIVSPSDIGKTLCARIGWTPQSSSNPARGWSVPACATIRSDFQLYPDAKFSGQRTGILQPGATTTTDETMYNAGSKATTDANYGAYQFKIPAGTAVNFGSVFNQNSGGYLYAVADYSAAGNACNDWLKNVPQFAGKITCQSQTIGGSTKFNSGVVSLNDGTIIDANGYSVGDKVCRIVAVNHYNFGVSGNPTSRRISYPACVTIGKRPLVNIMGNDLRVGSALAVLNNANSGVTGSVAMIDGNVRGSWAEYGIFAPGAINTMASGSRFMSDGVGSDPSDWSKLTFADDNGVYGKYAPPASMGVQPNVSQYFTNATLPPSFVKATGIANTTVSGYTANKIIIDSGTVTINQSITAPVGPITNGEAGIAQMVIIASGDIRITPNVQNIDAWLIAPNGTIDTCFGAPAQLTTNDCNQQLTITGPVTAKHLNLRRTYGTKNQYAETMNLRSDSYMWAHQISASNGSWQTKYTTELPPRY